MASSMRSLVRLGVCALVLTASSSMAGDYDISVATLNIRAGLDSADGGLIDIMDVIQTADPDVVILQEVHLNTDMTGRCSGDQFGILAAGLAPSGYTYTYHLLTTGGLDWLSLCGPGPVNSGAGLMVLSKLPLTSQGYA